MATLTREQVKTWNTDNQNGFTFDVMSYLTHGEKQLSKQIKIDDMHVLTVSILYRAEWETKTNSYGCKWNVETGRQIPNLHVSFGTISGSMIVSHGLGYWQAIADARTNKSYKVLQGLTSQFDDAKCIEIYENLTKTQVNRYA